MTDLLGVFLAALPLIIPAVAAFAIGGAALWLGDTLDDLTGGSD